MADVFPTHHDRFMPQPVGSRKGLLAEPVGKPSELCPPDLAARRARALISCYRGGEAEDPDSYVAALIVLLTAYPVAQVYMATDPRTGVQGDSKFLPTIAEVKLKLERLMAPIYYAERRARIEQERLAILPAPRPAGPRPVPDRVRQVQASLAAAVLPVADTAKLEPFTLQLVAGQDAFAGKPLTVGPDFARRMGFDRRDAGAARREEPWLRDDDDRSVDRWDDCTAAGEG